jgi:hypothetical protein
MNDKLIKKLVLSTKDNSIYNKNNIYKEVETTINPKKPLKDIFGDFFSEIFEFIERL